MLVWHDFVVKCLAASSFLSARIRAQNTYIMYIAILFSLFGNKFCVKCSSGIDIVGLTQASVINDHSYHYSIAFQQVKFGGNINLVLLELR